MRRVRGTFGHATSTAARTARAALARERDEPVQTAVTAVEPREPARQVPPAHVELEEVLRLVRKMANLLTLFASHPIVKRERLDGAVMVITPTGGPIASAASAADANCSAEP